MANKARHTQTARLLAAAAIVIAIGALPFAAFATSNEDAAAGTETAAEAHSASADAQSSDAAALIAPEDLYGLYAATGETKFANEEDISTAAEGACGVYAASGGTVVANALSVQTAKGASAAVATSAEGGSISIANSQLKTAGTDSPLLQSAGTVEVDNVDGVANTSQIARLSGSGSIVIAGSSLASNSAGTLSSDPIANGIILYRETSGDGEQQSGKSALFQASGSTLSSNILSGAFFYLTNTTATIVLADTDLDFDTEKALLLEASANSAGTWGATGKNGATVTFTALDQDLDGDIDVDSLSSVDLYLLEGSKWKGAASITANSAGTALSNNITVNIDSTSGWTVTENSTVSILNIEKGGSLVDAKGKSVTIVDADGNTLVDGASDVKVSVTGEFSTTVKTSDINGLRASTIDRAAFDDQLGTSTAFGTNGTDSATADEEKAAALQQLVSEWFRGM